MLLATLAVALWVTVQNLLKHGGPQRRFASELAVTVYSIRRFCTVPKTRKVSENKRGQVTRRGNFPIT